MKKERFSSIKLIFSLLLLISLLIPITQCKKAASDQDQLVEVTNITPAEAKQLIDANQGNGNFVILDVRTPAEFNSGHIEDAINIDFNAGDFQSQVNMLDIRNIYLVYCRSGNRSAQAASIMVNLGFQQLYNMLGGISQWQAGGFEIIIPN
jgi:rhodanese-related sulfurtransferase